MEGVQRLADVTREPVRWLWPGRVPLGKLTVLDGDPGLGKSALTLDLAARVSRGAALPDGSHGDLDGPVDVVLLSAEDGLADTIRPRLEAAGADLARVVALTGIQTPRGPRPVTLPLDWLEVARAVARAAARLVVVDPLMAYLDTAVNAYRDQDVRRGLAPLVFLADRLDAAIVVVRHLTKATEANPLYRGGGSIGILGVARSSLLVAADPDDPTGQRRVLAVVKTNLAAPAPALAFTMEALPAPASNAGPGAVRVVWHGEMACTAAALLATGGAAPDPAARDAMLEAQEFLRALLADGPQPAQAVLAAARAAGIAEKTLRRAKIALAVAAQREAFGPGGTWWWALPPRPATPREDSQPPGDRDLAHPDPAARPPPVAE